MGPLSEEENTHRIRIKKKHMRSTVVVRDALDNIEGILGDPELAKKMEIPLREALKSDSPVRIGVDSDSGRYFLCDIGTDDDGDAVVVLRNRTPERKKERSYLETIRVLQRKELLADTMSHFAHEVRNGLAVISGMSDMIRGRSLLTESQQHYIDTIYNTSLAVGGRCSAYLALSKGYDPEFKPVDVRETLEIIANIYEVRYKNESVELSRDYNQGIPQITGNNDLLLSLWQNLIQNACESVAEKGGGKVSITTEKGAEHVKVCIEDTGRGMDEETLRMWKSQDPTPFTTKPNGNGFGRLVVIDILRRHKGAGYSLRSSPCNGTSFYVYLPVAGKEQQP